MSRSKKAPAGATQKSKPSKSTTPAKLAKSAKPAKGASSEAKDNRTGDLFAPGRRAKAPEADGAEARVLSASGVTAMPFETV